MFLSASKVTLSPALTSWSLMSPPFSPSLVFAAVAFQATKFLILVSPASVRLLRFVSALLPTESILALVSALILTVTLSPDAAVSMPSAPLILNFNPSALFKFWLFVSLALSPPNLMLLLATALNWLPLIASLESALMFPFATLVILTGSVPLLPDTFKSLPSVLVNLGPLSPPSCTLLNLTSSLVAKVNLPSA